MTLNNYLKRNYVIDRIYVLHNYVLLTITYSSSTMVLLTIKKLMN